MKLSHAPGFVLPLHMWCILLSVLLFGCGVDPLLETFPALGEPPFVPASMSTSMPHEMKAPMEDAIFDVQQAELIAFDGQPDDRLGWSVAISGDTAIVGAYAEGAAYVFTRYGVTWTQTAKLFPSDVTSLYEYSVAISGDTAIVGMPRATVGSNYKQGAAYVFTGSGTIWTQQAKLTASDGQSDDQFGYAVAISGDTVIVGPYNESKVGNSAYVFTRSGTVWTEQPKLTPSDAAVVDRFGAAIAISGDRALVGGRRAHNAPPNVIYEGVAYIFDRNGTDWIQSAILVGGGPSGDGFGLSVALSGDRALVGAESDYIGGHQVQGSAHVFEKVGANWFQQPKLVASDGAAYNYFGYSVALSGDTALVGSPGSVIGSYQEGAVYVFTESGLIWSQQSKLMLPNAEEYDVFGFSMAVSGNTAIVGAIGRDIGQVEDQGAAYVFLRGASGDTCATATECSSGFCADGVCCDSPCLGPCEACSAAVKQQGSDGQCEFIAKGTPPSVVTDCPAEPASSCGLTGLCDGSGSCELWTTCGTTCSGNMLVQNACSGAGICGPSQTMTDCAPFLCQNDHCTTTCSTNADCAAYAYCDATAACQPKFPNGAACGSSPTVCISGNCVDGVCCDADCSDTCRACIASKTGQPDGTCADIPSDSDPDNECLGGLGCSGIGSCKQLGGGSCVAAADCVTGFCVDGVCCDSACGNGADDCQACSIAMGANIDGICITRPANSVCRPATGGCDIAEACDGASTDCPSDAIENAGTECRPKTGECDIVESCNGVSRDCPTDSKVPAGTECRAKSGACDTAEICDGVSGECPMDSKEQAGTECRSKAGECDAPETCNGTSNICPPDDFAANGTVCSQGVCLDGTCADLVDGGDGNGGNGATDGSASFNEHGTCNCRLPNGTRRGSASLVALGLMAVVMRRRTNVRFSLKHIAAQRK